VLVRSGLSEIGITELPVAEERIRTRPLGRQELVAIFPPRTKRPRQLGLAEFAHWPLVTQPTGTSTRDALDSAFSTVNAKALVAVETDQREAIVPLVLAGAGAAVVPKPMAVVARQQGATVASLRPALWRDLGLVYRSATLSPAARAFIELATSHP
jgi:DNA-binding transcriptional LysR family regulator